MAGLEGPKIKPSSGERHQLTRHADTDAAAADGDKKHAADMAPPSAAEACVAKGEQRLRLSSEYVHGILGLTLGVPVVDPDEEYALLTNLPGKMFSQEFIDESVEIARDMAETDKSCFEWLGKLQGWMRAEMEEKGYVEVGEEYIAQRERTLQFIQAEMEAQTELWVNAFGPMEKNPTNT